MENRKEDLRENIRKFLGSAELIYKIGDFTSATILYFKAMFAALDFIIFIKDGKIPKDNKERFRILELNYNEYYLILDKIYPIYRASYNLAIEKNYCDKVKENVEKIIREQKIL